MHAAFEIKCTLQRKVHVEGNKINPKYNSFEMSIPVKQIPIDSAFIDKYMKIDIPYAKAGDSIFIAVAKAHNFPIITEDKGMIKVAKEAELEVYTINDALSSLK